VGSQLLCSFLTSLGVKNHGTLVPLTLCHTNRSLIGSGCADVAGTIVPSDVLLRHCNFRAALESDDPAKPALFAGTGTPQPRL
jgi:hypothetical protein